VKSASLVRLIALGGVVAALAAVMFLTSGSRPHSAEATANPLPPLIACPNMDASPDNKVTVADILTVVSHYGKSYGQPGYEYLWDSLTPYNSTSPANTGSLTVADILYVVNHYGNTCPLLETQIATATRAIADPTFSSMLCDPTFATAMNCGGDPQFLTENVGFLSGKGYLRGSTDVPGQGIHYINMSIWDGLFNPAHPEGLVYKGGVLVAQLYYAEGDVVGWSPNAINNVRAVNTDSFCTPVGGEPPGTGCGWSGTLDGWHWHANLCTWAIGTPSAVALPGPTSQAICAATAAGAGHPCAAFYPAAGWNCTWKAGVGYMGHLWNWLPNADYTSAQDPGPSGLGDCQVAYCNTLENNGRFADCFPDGSTWKAYDCPQ
jgi:hypothetical protein